jgi:hypothetical protein
MPKIVFIISLMSISLCINSYSITICTTYTPLTVISSINFWKIFSSTMKNIIFDTTVIIITIFKIYANFLSWFYFFIILLISYLTFIWISLSFISIFLFICFTLLK